MHEVIVLCEGHTEREFCKRVIAPELYNVEISLAGTLVGSPQRKQGGIQEWEVYRKELLRLANERRDRHVGMLVDYYRMPKSWPGRRTASGRSPTERGKHVEEALIENLRAELNDRFHPCVQLHEFESLLFVEPEISAQSIAVGAGLNDEQDHIVRQLMDVREEYNGNVELIDDSPNTAPSKRIATIIPGYDKVAWGILAMDRVGLQTLRDGCPWLDRWLTRLESIGREI